MKFSLVFDKSGDELPFEVYANHELFEYFVATTNSKKQNSFSDDRAIYHAVDKKIAHLQWAISNTNEVLYDLIGVYFDQSTDLEKYLDQHVLNKTHSDWVFSHKHQVEIDKLRFSENIRQAKLGNKLHELLSDDIRSLETAPALEKLGYIYPFREVNMGIHDLENSFVNLEFKAAEKWQVFDNPFTDTMVTNNDIVNFSFGYTYVGRQYYNKFRFYDLDLQWPDHYNYNELEFAFQLNLSNPETVPFSKEATQWANSRQIKLVAEQVPIANLVNIRDNLFEYRKILYRNSRDNNSTTINIH